MSMVQCRRLQYEAYRVAQRNAVDASNLQPEAKVVSWLPLEATLRREPVYKSKTGVLQYHEAEVSANFAKAAVPPARPRLRETAAGKAGEGNTTGNERLLLLPVVDGVVKIG